MDVEQLRRMNHSQASKLVSISHRLSFAIGVKDARFAVYSYLFKQVHIGEVKGWFETRLALECAKYTPPRSKVTVHQKLPAEHRLRAKTRPRQMCRNHMA